MRTANKPALYLDLFLAYLPRVFYDNHNSFPPGTPFTLLNELSYVRFCDSGRHTRTRLSLLSSSVERDATAFKNVSEYIFVETSTFFVVFAFCVLISSWLLEGFLFFLSKSFTAGEKPTLRKKSQYINNVHLQKLNYCWYLFDALHLDCCLHVLVILLK